jgi:hypothetical protein
MTCHLLLSCTCTAREDNHARTARAPGLWDSTLQDREEEDGILMHRVQDERKEGGGGEIRQASR